MKIHAFRLKDILSSQRIPNESKQHGLHTAVMTFIVKAYIFPVGIYCWALQSFARQNVLVIYQYNFGATLYLLLLLTVSRMQQHG